MLESMLIVCVCFVDVCHAHTESLTVISGCGSLS